MQIRHLHIQNFRGIRELDRRIDRRLVCLVGPGDSTKTTILHAVEYALSPRYTLQINDTDSYNCDTDQTIRVDVTLAEFPADFLKDDKFGLHLRGWRDGNGIVDEPSDDCEHVITIRFSVDASLEPAWEVFTERHDSLPTISWPDRAKLGVGLLGADVERNLSWARGSAPPRRSGRRLAGRDYAQRRHRGSGLRLAGRRVAGT